MGMKKSLMTMMPLLAMAMMGDMTGENPHNEPLTKEDREKALKRKQERLATAEEKRRVRQGQKKFFYGEEFIWALNQKSADRKATTKGYI